MIFISLKLQVVGGMYGTERQGLEPVREQSGQRISPSGACSGCHAAGEACGMDTAGPAGLAVIAPRAAAADAGSPKRCSEH